MKRKKAAPERELEKLRRLCMKTFQDLLASVARLSDAFNALAAAIAAQPAPVAVDYTSITAIIDNITAQVQQLTQKLTPPTPAA